MSSYYPESKVEVSGFLAKHYDTLIDVATLGRFSSMTQKAIHLMEIKPTDKILDLGAGTGRNAQLMGKYLSPEGELIGFDISEEMISQFKTKCAGFPNISIVNARIDQDLPYKSYFDKVFISFVLHGFPQKIQEKIIHNAFEALLKGGEFIILDYNEFPLDKTPFYLKAYLKLIECRYAFDFIKRDWKNILAKQGFNHFREYFFLKRYVRLLIGAKTP